MTNHEKEEYRKAITYNDDESGRAGSIEELFDRIEKAEDKLEEIEGVISRG